MLLNPRHRRRHHRHHGHYRRNPEGPVGAVTDLVRHPGDALATGFIGAASAYMTLSVPNNFLPFAGNDILSRVLRLFTRAAAGGILYSLVRKMSPRYGAAALSGAAIASVGSFVLEFLGTTLPIGVPLAAGVMPLLPIGNFNLGLSTAGMGAYARLRGYTGPVLNAARAGGGTGGGSSFIGRGTGLAGPSLTRHSLFG